MYVVHKSEVFLIKWQVGASSRKPEAPPRVGRARGWRAWRRGGWGCQCVAVRCGAVLRCRWGWARLGQGSSGRELGCYGLTQGSRVGKGHRVRG